MNHETKKTLAFAAAALALAAAAALVTRPRVTTAEAFNDQGQPFFPDFKDPRTAQTLEVIGFDPETASAIPFKVTYEPGKGWVIPSHHDYPADAQDRLARTAASVIDLKKDVIASDNPAQHEELGVLDPLDAKATSLRGRGQRITLKDKAGKALADFIIGKPVRGREKQRYVRVPGQKRTYAVTVTADLSTRFSDWIETNLLKLNPTAMTRVRIDNHKVDPEQGTITPGDQLTLERTGSSGSWTLTGGLPPDRELDAAKVSGLTGALADLKIVGVRPKPPGLTAELKAEGSPENVRTSEAVLSLMRRGFYLTRDGRLLSNQGDVQVATDEGILYTLRFGEVTFATGEALSAGSEQEGTPDPAKKEPAKKDAGGGENRFLMVTVRFDPELIPKPDAPKAGGELPSEVFQRSPDEIKRAQDEANRKQEDYRRKLADGQKKAQELTDRFAAWYYVVPGDAFRSIVLDRSALIRPKAAPASGGMDLPPGPGGNPDGPQP